MNYSLEFHPDALKEWRKLPKHICEQFKKILIRRLKNPKVPSAKLSGNLKNCYKIKLRKAGYRLIYQIKDNELIIVVVAVGRRENNLVYDIATQRN